MSDDAASAQKCSRERVLITLLLIAWIAVAENFGRGLIKKTKTWKRQSDRLCPSPVQSADDVKEEDLAQGLITWASADSPWVHIVEPSEFSKSLNRIRQINPKMILSAHLPMARGKTERFLDLLSKVQTSTPFVAPNQAALEQLLAQS